MTSHEIRHLQEELNRFTKDHHDLGRSAVRVDGHLGTLTKKRVHEAKWDLGYLDLKGEINDNFYHRMRHPTGINLEWNQTREAVARGKKRRRARRIAVARNRIRAFLKPGIGTFDGVPVAKSAIPVLNWCRGHGWHGRLVSGYRTPAYSEGLCYQMCGRPSCPGRCAGRATNHAYAVPSRFAIDVSDYVNFGHIVARCPIQPRVHNSLPNDLVHFSPQGN